MLAPDQLAASLALPAAEEENEDTIRKHLAAVYRICDQLKLNEGVCNHLSAMLPALPGQPFRFLVIRYGLGWDEVTAENLVCCDDKGSVLSGQGPVETTAIQIHAAVHLSNPKKYACVLHTHMPYTTALCTTERFELSMCHQNSLRFYDDISYDRTYQGLVFDDEEGRRLAAKLGGKTVLLHRCHGPIVTGPSVAVAFDHLYYLERAAQIQVLAMSVASRSDQLCQIDEAIARRTKQQITDDVGYAARAHLGARMRALERAAHPISASWPSLLALVAAGVAGLALGATIRAQPH